MGAGTWSAYKRGFAFLRRFLATLVAVILCGTGVAQADVPELSPSLRIRVQGDVPTVCGLSNGLAASAPVMFENAVAADSNTARADRVALPFSVRCNSPMTVAMTSDNGGLQTAARTTDADFTSRISYTAALRLPDGSTALTCDSTSMDGGEGACAGEVQRPVTDGEGAVEIVLNPDGRLLLRGEYRDRVTVTVSPVLGGAASI